MTPVRRQRASAPVVPPLAERERPGLSETLTGPRRPDRCQSCGIGASADERKSLVRYLEYDAWDRAPMPPIVVVLCTHCAARLVEPHARIYAAVRPGEPVPGCMGVCLSCAHRDGVACTSRDAQINGGPGLSYTWKHPPTSGIICGGRGHHGGHRGCQSVVMFSGPVLTCSGRKAT